MEHDLAMACSTFEQCGGCELLCVPYDEQLKEKRRVIEGLFSGISPDSEVLPVIGMEHPYHYRNKVSSPYAPAKGSKTKGGKRAARSPEDAKGKKAFKRSKRSGGSDGSKGACSDKGILCGMYAKGTHRLVDTGDCLIENETGAAVIRAVRDVMGKWGIAPYDEDSGTGFMRHAIVRVAHSSGEVLLTLVTNSEDFPNSRSFARELVKRAPQVTAIVQNVNLRKTNVILGERERVLYGPGFILDRLCGLSVRLSSQSFYQVNCAQAEVLYAKAAQMAHLSGTETVIDAYCGAGLIGLVAAAHGAARVIGIECVGSAVDDAVQNARHNGIENARFVVADATDFLVDAAKGEQPELFAGNGEDVLVLMMDPPRAGATEEFLSAAAALAPARIVYISCNPKTQARDIAFLVKHGYRVCEIQPVDMFPHTDHIENIVSLCRR